VLNRVLQGGLAALGAAVVVVTIPAPHAAEPVPVSYRHDLATLVQAAPYPVVAPAALPATWTPVNSAVTLGGAAGAGTVTWALGYATPSGTLASVEETNANANPFVRRMTNGGTVLLPGQPPPVLDGRNWTFSATPARGERSLYVTSPAGFTVVVTGNASWADLRRLAASLRPVSG